MNLETKITIYKFTPQLFTLTLMKPVTAPTSNNAINGLKQKTPAVPANMNKHARKNIPISSVRCTMIITAWKNMVNVPMLPNH